ncbi:MAG: hypothetical protein QOG44_1643 [Acidimicrobiaceae bacterium]|nr:hypothetical protein [Acidimicrobiaceae bacterium]
MTEPVSGRAGGTIIGRSASTTPSEEAAEVEATFAELSAEPLDPEPAVPAADRTETVLVPASGSLAARWSLVGCVVLALAALVFAVVALQQRSALQAERDRTTELRDVSGKTIAALTSYDYQHLDVWKKSVLANSTGSFQNQFESGFTGFEQAYIAEHNRGTGSIQGVWVGPVDAGKATTVVLAQITVTSLTGTHSLEPYVQLTLLKVAGHWRVDDVQATFDTGGGASSGADGTPVPQATTTVPPAP